MKIVWDIAKAKTNEEKHGVSFADASIVLDDPMALVSEGDSQGEQRFQAIGADARGRVLAVIFTYRGDCLRLISARKAERWERQLYEDEP
ncbi:MAG: BrnT family toxin [Magnetococcales bacterium]|nr:BrnT family toxin [Magnetococcales bacterium]